MYNQLTGVLRMA